MKEELIKPNFNFKQQEKQGNKAIFVLEPLEEGYGHTLGTGLRRVLLSSLSGSAITSVKMSGVKHQFATVEGMSDDVLQFVLNLKKVRILNETSSDSVKVKLAASGPGVVTAGQLEVPAGVKVANPDLQLATLASKSSSLKVEMTVERGYGYSLASERMSDTVGLITMDANFSPIVRANYRVEATRVGRATNYDKLVLEVETDGTVMPEEAVRQAAQILVDHYMLVVNPEKAEMKKEEGRKEERGLELAKLSVEELALPTRIVNALVRGGYETVADLLAAKREDLLQVKNLGAKSLEEVEVALREKGVKLFQ